MAQTFDMKRLHQGCGESLQSNLLDLVMIKKPRWPMRILDKRQRKNGGRQAEPGQAEERFWG